MKTFDELLRDVVNKYDDLEIELKETKQELEEALQEIENLKEDNSSMMETLQEYVRA